jgi:hypothetical protein
MLGDSDGYWDVLMKVARPSPSHYNTNDVMPTNMVKIIRVVGW